MMVLTWFGNDGASGHRGQNNTCWWRSRRIITSSAVAWGGAAFRAPCGRITQYNLFHKVLWPLRLADHAHFRVPLQQRQRRFNTHAQQPVKSKQHQTVSACLFHQHRQLKQTSWHNLPINGGILANRTRNNHQSV